MTSANFKTPDVPDLHCNQQRACAIASKYHVALHGDVAHNAVVTTVMTSLIMDGITRLRRNLPCAARGRGSAHAPSSAASGRGRGGDDYSPGTPGPLATRGRGGRSDHRRGGGRSTPSYGGQMASGLANPFLYVDEEDHGIWKVSSRIPAATTLWPLLHAHSHVYT